MKRLLNEKKKNKIDPNLLYSENAEFHRYILDWRHKILVRYLILIAGLLYISKWLFESKNYFLNNSVVILFLISSIISVMFYFMDKRNANLMKTCSEVGRNIEDKCSNIDGYYKTIPNEKVKFTYTRIFKYFYLGLSALFLIICLVLLYMFSLKGGITSVSSGTL